MLILKEEAFKLMRKDYKTFSNMMFIVGLFNDITGNVEEFRRHRLISGLHIKSGNYQQLYQALDDLQECGVIQYDKTSKYVKMLFRYVTRYYVFTKTSDYNLFPKEDEYIEMFWNENGWKNLSEEDQYSRFMLSSSESQDDNMEFLFETRSKDYVYAIQED